MNYQFKFITFFTEFTTCWRNINVNVLHADYIQLCKNMAMNSVSCYINDLPAYITVPLFVGFPGTRTSHLKKSITFVYIYHVHYNGSLTMM
jgi:hypothetical protein